MSDYETKSEEIVETSAVINGMKNLKEKPSFSPKSYNILAFPGLTIHL